MIELSNLSYKELQELEGQIEKRKEVLRKSKDCAVGYKVTFCVKFNPYTHENDELNNTQDFGVRCPAAPWENHTTDLDKAYDIAYNLSEEYQCDVDLYYNTTGTLYTTVSAY